MARATGLTRAAARRFLLTLVELGYVRTDGRLFSLRPRMLELGYAYLSSLSLPEVASRTWRRWSRRCTSPRSVSVLDGDEVVYVARVPTKRIMTRGDQRRHPVPGLRHLDGAGAAGRAADDWLDDYLASATLRAADLAHRSPTPAKLRTELTAVRRAGLRAGRPGAGGGPALARRADPRRDGQGRRGGEHLRARQPRAGRGDPQGRLLPPLLETAKRIEEDLRGGQTP